MLSTSQVVKHKGMLHLITGRNSNTQHTTTVEWLFYRWTWVHWSSLSFLSPLLRKEPCGINGTGLFYKPHTVSVASPKRYCPSTEGNTENWLQPFGLVSSFLHPPQNS